MGVERREPALPSSDGVADAGHETPDEATYRQALHESEERFRRLAEATHEGIVILDGDHVIDANPQAAAMLGYELSEYVGMRVFALIAPESQALAAEHMVTEDQRPWEGMGLHKNGTRVLLEARARVVRSGDRVLRVAVFRDIGEQRAREQRFRETEKMQVIGRLAGSVAHDFNNLLTIILGCADLVEQEVPEDSPARLLAREIASAGERAAALTRQLLAFSRRQVIDLRVVDLNRVILGMSQLLERLLGEDVHVSLDLSSTLRFIRADVGQLEQIVMNLCTNARDAMPQGGEIAVRTETTIDGGDPPEAREPGGCWVHLTVTDRGGGMDPATLRQAFEPLFTTKEIGRGTGLGLSTVRAIVTQSGGRVTIDSEAGRGTTVHVWLPALDIGQAAPEVKPPEKTAPRGTETVLLVEDEPGVRALCDGVLRSLGYSVIVALPGEAERTAHLHRGAIELLITDVVMPGIRGPAVAAAVRQSSPRARVLFVSGYFDEVLSTQALGAGFLAKPFTPLELARKVREVLAG
ncbi:MAG TPA: ATP-binding protein [Polyangiaceae bacterium]|jgi:PAS domain S-box-containing protein|nr:ATP-binding protein [Polyangiaceae bacterium]